MSIDMNSEVAAKLQETVALSLAAKVTFPEVVGRLIECGVERYHTDYSRQETTYYLADGDSAVVSTPHPPHQVGEEFSAAAVEAAIRQSQRNEHTYADFVQKTMAAGCVGYFVQITGRRAIYFGRKGESHVELFPSPDN
jgi:uncharacterized protein YbcV (DUF1398 family)